LAAIGNPEAKTYGGSFAYMGILMIARALGFLILMIGLRARQAEGEQPPLLSKTESSSWIATKLFVVGWGMAVASAYVIVATLPYLVWYVAQEKNDYGFDWCYECSGWTFSLGPEPSMIVSAISLTGLAVGIIMVMTKGRRISPPISKDT
jgi:hypothetical protein